MDGRIYYRLLPEYISSPLLTHNPQPTGPIKAKLLFVHGYSEHINRYNDFFPALAAQGIRVFAWDQRGWGRSVTKPSERGLTGPTARVVADVAALVKDKLAPAGVPLFVMGHSMGGGEVCTLMGDPEYEELVRQVRGWILESPFIGFSPESEPSKLKVVLGRLAARLFPHQQMKNVIPEVYLSRDAAVVESVKKDPLCHNMGTLEGLSGLLDRTALLASGDVKVGKHVQSLFLAHGTEDKACSYDAAIKWADQQTNVEDRLSKSYEGAYHQLHTDFCKDEFTADVVDFIMKRSGSQAGAPLESKL